MSFPRYDKYKDSGVEWLGEVPEHWSVSRLGYESWVRARLGWKGLKANEYVDDGFIFLSTPNIKGAEIDFENVNYIDEFRFEESPEIKLRIGDVLLAKDGSTLGTVNVVRTLPRPATVNSSIAVISPNERIYGVYLYYLFQSRFMIETIQRIKGGMGVPHLFQENLTKFYLPLPSLVEQNSIIDFLEHETGKIDSLIEEQQRLIELLKEKRQAVISHAVTKGLNPNAPMKPSGIDWLGDVPVHWKVQPLKRTLVDIKAGPFGSSLTKDMYTTAGYKIYGQEQVIPNDFSVGDYFVSAEIFDSLKQYSVGPGDILISCVGTFGKVAIVPEAAQAGIINPRLLRLRCSKDVLPEFLAVSLRSDVTHSQFSYLSRGGTMDVINIETLNNISVAVPPLIEQSAILAFIATEEKKMTSLLAEATNAINLLQERRSALISAAVTGKIDVRNAVPEPVA